MMLKNEGGNGDIHLQIPKAEEGFGKPKNKYGKVQNNWRMSGS